MSLITLIINAIIAVDSNKSRFEYVDGTLKGLPQKPEPLVIEKITQHLGSIGAIYYT